jgi:hypothetical protein
VRFRRTIAACARPPPTRPASASPARSRLCQGYEAMIAGRTLPAHRGLRSRLRRRPARRPPEIQFFCRRLRRDVPRRQPARRQGARSLTSAPRRSPRLRARSGPSRWPSRGWPGSASPPEIPRARRPPRSRPWGRRSAVATSAPRASPRISWSAPLAPRRRWRAPIWGGARPLRARVQPGGKAGQFRAPRRDARGPPRARQIPEAGALWPAPRGAGGRRRPRRHRARQPRLRGDAPRADKLCSRGTGAGHLSRAR